MSMKRTEKVSRMMEEFMKLHKEGHSIQEIAAKYELDVSTVYNSLQEIAEKNHVTRESLLKRAYPEHINKEVRKVNSFVKENPKELRESFAKAIKDVEEIIKFVDKRLEGEEQYE